ncbi:fimbrial protein [Atlantibacter subterranea]|jgi:major type 1 subunit fimbrin (pilin)|nr:fimbrial protein [Atlantibacter subterranea]
MEINIRGNIMKKALMAVAVSAMFATGASLADTNTPATLSITGTVTDSTIPVACGVSLNTASVNLTGMVSSMKTQGQNVSGGTLVSMSVTGGAQCDQLVNNYGLAYKFVGTPDNADGTVLANTATGDTAAAGVGVGVFSVTGATYSLGANHNAKDTHGFSLALVKLNGQTATAGNVQSTLTVQLDRL